MRTIWMGDPSWLAYVRLRLMILLSSPPPSSTRSTAPPRETLFSTADRRTGGLSVPSRFVSANSTSRESNGRNQVRIHVAPPVRTKMDGYLAKWISKDQKKPDVQNKTIFNKFLYTKKLVCRLVSARRDKSITDGRTNGPTNRPTERRTDTPSYRVVPHD